MTRRSRVMDRLEAPGVIEGWNDEFGLSGNVLLHLALDRLLREQVGRDVRSAFACHLAPSQARAPVARRARPSRLAGRRP
jgi:hypothetical protein